MENKFKVLSKYPIKINKNLFGIKDSEAEKELFDGIQIKREKYDKEVVEYLSKLWEVPFNYLLGRLRSEVGHNLLYAEKNLKEAQFYYDLASKENQSAESFYALGTLKLNMLPTIDGFNQAIEIFKKATLLPHKIQCSETKEIDNKSVIESYLMIGNLYFDGFGGNKNLEESLKYYKLAEEKLGEGQDYTPGFAKLGLNYCRGQDGFEKNPEKGLKILKQIIDNGSIEAGILYSYGESLFENGGDQKIAIEYIRKAAKKGYPIAKKNLGSYEDKIQSLKIKSINGNNNNNTPIQLSKKGKPKQIKKNNLC